MLTATVKGVALVAVSNKYNKRTVLYFLFARCKHGQPHEARFADKKTGQGDSVAVL